MKTDKNKVGIWGGVHEYQVIRPDGSVKVWPGSGNLIVDSGLELLGGTSPTDAARYCRVGTGTTPPAADQVGLVSQFGGVSGIGQLAENTNSGVAPWWQQSRRTFIFPPNTIDGAALTELGFFNAPDVSSPMFSRLLFRDAEGDPTARVILPDEELRVIYDIRVYTPELDVAGTITVENDGLPAVHNYTLRAANANNVSAWSPAAPITLFGQAAAYSTDQLGPVTGTPSGAASSSNSSTSPPYVPGSYARSASPIFGLARANFIGGIGALTFSNSLGVPQFQAVFTPKIPKNDTQTLSMQEVVTKVWARR